MSNFSQLWSYSFEDLKTSKPRISGIYLTGVYTSSKAKPSKDCVCNFSHYLRNLQTFLVCLNRVHSLRACKSCETCLLEYLNMNEKHSILPQYILTSTILYISESTLENKTNIKITKVTFTTENRFQKPVPTSNFLRFVYVEGNCYCEPC